jgi:regulator of nonsense transcripts 2
MHRVLADAIGGEMPDLKDSEDASVTGSGGIGLVKTGEYLRGEGDGAGIWEDEDERRFYENLVDLKGKVPGCYLRMAKKKKARHRRASWQEESIKQMSPPQKALQPPAKEDDQSTAIANKTIGAQVDALLARLPDLTSKD